MNALRTMTAAFLTTALAVLIPRLAGAVVDAYLLGHPDSKFGAAGGVQFVAFFVGIAAVVAGLLAAAIAFARKTRPLRAHLVSALVGGLILSLMSFWIPDLAVYGVGYALFGEVGMIVTNRAVVCAVVVLLVQLTIGASLPPQPLSRGRAQDRARR